MAISANSVWEIRTTGSDSNGGAFVTGAGGTDYSQQDAAQYSAADLTVDSVTATKVTSASHSFVSTDVGNLMQITAGAGFTVGFYQIVSVASGAATLDRSPAALSTAGGTYAVGGALASCGRAAGSTISGNTVFVKYSATAYAITAATTNVAGGCIAPVTNVAWVGYDTTRSIGNLDANRPTLQIAAAVSAATIFTGTTTPLIQNLILDGNGQTTSRGTLTRGIIWRCKGQNFTNSAFADNATERRYGCEATACSGAVAFAGGWNYWCESHGNSVSGFGSFGFSFGCISWGNTGASSTGFTSTECTNCVADRNGSHGFSAQNNTMGNFANCVATNNTGVGFAGVSTGGRMMLVNCATSSNTGGSTSNLVSGSPVALSGDPFTASSSGNFSTISTGAGAALRAAGFPATFPAGLTASYADLGAAQHQDSGGGGTTVTNLFVLMD